MFFSRSVRTRKYHEIIKFLEESIKQNLFDAFSIPDNAGGHPAHSPIPMGKTVKSSSLSQLFIFLVKIKIEIK